MDTIFRILFFVLSTLHDGKVDGKESNYFKIQGDFLDFETVITAGHKDQPVRTSSGRGLKDLWCNLYRYR